MTRKLHSHLLLLLTALIWGVAFVAQDVAMDYLPPFTFNGSRMLLAGIALMPFVFRSEKKEKISPSKNHKTLYVAGFWCGLMLFFGSSFQQLGIAHTSAGKAGFITALYIVLVPLLGLFRGKKVRIFVWIAVVLCTLGLFLLCINESFQINLGDIYLLFCALSFAGHILVVDSFAHQTNPIRLSCMQFFVCGILSLITALIFEKPTLSGFISSLIPILYAGLLSGGVGYTLQIIGQRDTDPTVASLILCLESVFAVLAAWLLLGDTLSFRELSGCVLMFIGILLAQMPSQK